MDNKEKQKGWILIVIAIIMLVIQHYSRGFVNTTHFPNPIIDIFFRIIAIFFIVAPFVFIWKGVQKLLKKKNNNVEINNKDKDKDKDNALPSSDRPILKKQWLYGSVILIILIFLSWLLLKYTNIESIMPIMSVIVSVLLVVGIVIRVAKRISK